LELFCAFKGVEVGKRAEMVAKMIKDLDLYEKANDLSKNLSGG